MLRLRTILGVTGELLITAGVVVLLFVVWQLGYVSVLASREQESTVSDLQRGFAAAPAPEPTAEPELTVLPGEAWGVLRAPRLGADWAKPVLEGTSADVLAQGLGHYPGTALPGQEGNVGIAGHRAGHGNPLIDIDSFRPGDLLVLETAAGFDSYRVQRSFIVPPTDVDVLAPVPTQPDLAPDGQWLTLTSCEPRYGSSSRYIVVSTFEEHRERESGAPTGPLAPPTGGS